MPEIETLFKNSPGEFAQYLQAFGKVVHLPDLANRLGFNHHPVWQKCLLEKAVYSKKVSVATQLTYSVTVEDQFDDLRQLACKRKRATDKKQQGVRRWHRIMEVEAGDSKFSVAAVEKHAMMMHLKLTMSQDRVYAIPAHTAQLQPFAAEARTAQAREPEELEADAPRRPPPSRVETKFVKLLAPDMSRQKLGPVPAAASAHLPSHSLCVAVHDAWPCGPTLGAEAPTAVYVEPKEMHSIQDHLAVLALCHADVAALKEGMLAYSAKTGLMYNIQGLPPEVAAEAAQIMRELVLNSAFPDSASGLSVAASNRAALQALAVLQDCGYTDSALQGHERVWRSFGAGMCGLCRLKTTKSSNSLQSRTRIGP